MKQDLFRYADYLRWFEPLYREQSLPQGPPSLYDPLKYHFSGRGKRIRPALLAETAAAYGCSWEDSLPAALALEDIHNFTLIHDDLMDGDTQRHGLETLHIRYNADTAILAGDALYTLALKHLQSLDPEHYRLVTMLFTDSVLLVCEGQSMDMDFEKDSDVSLDSYFRMIELKTGHLLSAALQAGAVLGNATEEERHNIAEYALILGRAFQMQDDLLELTSSAEAMGKSLDSDIRSGKKTYPLILAREQAHINNDSALSELLGKKSYSDQEIQQIKELFHGTELYRLVMVNIRQQISRLDSIREKMPETVAAVLGLISEFILNRKT